MKTLSYEISARVKGTTLPILVPVLTSIDYRKAWFLTLCSSLHTRTSTRNKQQKLAQEKLLHKPRPFGLSVSRNLKLDAVSTLFISRPLPQNECDVDNPIPKKRRSARLGLHMKNVNNIE